MSSGTTVALDYLRNLALKGFWGAITLKFEKGEIVHVRREENLKPSDLSGPPRENNEYINYL